MGRVDDMNDLGAASVKYCVEVVEISLQTFQDQERVNDDRVQALEKLSSMIEEVLTEDINGCGPHTDVGLGNQGLNLH